MSEQIVNPSVTPVTELVTTDNLPQTEFDEVDYYAKVAFAHRAYSEQTAEAVDEYSQQLIAQLGGSRRVGGFDVWAAAKEDMRITASQEGAYAIYPDEELSGAYFGHKSQEEFDACDSVLADVYDDIASNVPSFNTGQQLANPMENKDLADPAMLGKTQKVISTLVHRGIYKLMDRNNANQLDLAARLIETYAEWVPDFDADKAGLDVAMAALIRIRATIQTDDQTKPHYASARPERSHTMRQTEDIIDRLNAARAHTFLSMYDITLPPEEQTA